MNAEAQRLGFIYSDPLTDKLFDLLKRFAATPYAVLLHGETGVGKEVIAEAIHLMSSRAKKPFIAINCASLNESLADSELFGHERGSFTGASSARAGAFETANEGTLFLDEIGDLPISIQLKLLRVLETKEVRRVGSDTTKKINVRLVGATHKDLWDEVGAKRFREDLFYRLVVNEVKVPPLRNRKLDIPPLCAHFLKQITIDLGPRLLTAEALHKLMSHSWPGNVRELRNVLQNAASVTPSVEIGPESIHPRPPRACTKPKAAPKALREIEKETLEAELTRNGWNRRETSRTLGIARSTVKEKIKRFGLKDPEQA
jgi:two-component system, NtrC family, response regulator HydG